MNYTKKILNATLLLIYLFLMLISWYYASNYLLDQNQIRDFVSRFYLISPIIFLILQIFYVILVPIYNTPIHLAGGYIFGPYLGFILNYIATSLGLFIIIFLSRRYGRNIITKLISIETVEKYDKLITSNKITPFFLFVVYVLPFFPDDEITYLIALSRLPFKTYIPAILLGNIPKAAVSFLGSNLIQGIFPTIMIRVIILFIGILYFFKKDILNLFKTH